MTGQQPFGNTMQQAILRGSGEATANIEFDLQKPYQINRIGAATKMF
jgi:hypothetical protein